MPCAAPTSGRKQCCRCMSMLRLEPLLSTRFPACMYIQLNACVCVCVRVCELLRALGVDRQLAAPKRVKKGNKIK